MSKKLDELARVEWLGKKGIIPMAMKGLKNLSQYKRNQCDKRLTEIKCILNNEESLIAEKCSQCGCTFAELKRFCPVCVTQLKGIGEDTPDQSITTTTNDLIATIDLLTTILKRSDLKYIHQIISEFINFVDCNQCDPSKLCVVPKSEVNGG